MNAKEKANKLVEKFYDKQVEILNKDGTTPINVIEHDIAKQCSRIVVEEIILVITSQTKIHRGELRFWNEVLKEIDLL